MTFVGYDKQSKAYRMLNKEKCKVEVSRNVRFVRGFNKDHKKYMVEQINIEEESNEEKVQFIFKGGVKSLQPLTHENVENADIKLSAASESEEESFSDATDSEQVDLISPEEPVKSVIRISATSTKGRHQQGSLRRFTLPC